MSRGRVHALATVIAGGVLSPSLVVLGHLPIEQASAFAAGCLTGLVINPDLDVRRFTHAESVMRRTGGRLGRLLSNLWYALWWPYSRLIPRHRHPLSHMPILGTVVRLIYLAVILFAIHWLIGLVISLPDLPMPGPLSWWGAAGLAVVDTLHYIMDRI